MLEVFYRLERRLMCVKAGTRYAIFDHTAEAICLMCVDECIVHANIGQAADKDQSLSLEPFQQDFEIRTIKGRSNGACR